MPNGMQVREESGMTLFGFLDVRRATPSSTVNHRSGRRRQGRHGNRLSVWTPGRSPQRHHGRRPGHGRAEPMVSGQSWPQRVVNELGEKRWRLCLSLAAALWPPVDHLRASAAGADAECWCGGHWQTPCVGAGQPGLWPRPRRMTALHAAPNAWRCERT